MQSAILPRSKSKPPKAGVADKRVYPFFASGWLPDADLKIVQTKTKAYQIPTLPPKR
jgi:hypothetical protein